MAEDVQDLILNAAEKEFAAKGFSGARVDQIAREAGVNKALLYYYFKSKKGLLSALYERLINKGFTTLEFEKLAKSDIAHDPEGFADFYHRLLHFFEPYRDILRILMMESVKNEGEKPILELARIYLDGRATDVVDKMQEHGFHTDADRTQWAVTEFFTGMIPFICYILFKEDVAQLLKVDSEELDTYFMRSIETTHLRSHQTEQK